MALAARLLLRKANRISSKSQGYPAIPCRFHRQIGLEQPWRWSSSEKELGADNDDISAFLSSLNLEDKNGVAIDTKKFTHKRELRMPDMGEGKNEIVQWLAEEGDLIVRGDVLCDIQTPDFVFGMEIDDEQPSILWKRLIEPNVQVSDDEIICWLLHEGKEEKKAEND